MVIHVERRMDAFVTQDLAAIPHLAHYLEADHVRYGPSARDVRVDTLQELILDRPEVGDVESSPKNLIHGCLSVPQDTPIPNYRLAGKALNDYATHHVTTTCLFHRLEDPFFLF